MTADIALLLLVLGATIVLFVTEALRVDVVAMVVMVTLPWLGLIEPDDAFVGFSRGAVVSIMAVVVMGHGLERTGVTRVLARPLERLGRGGPRRLLAGLLGSVGATSAFLQNVGAAALFLPVGLRLGRRSALRAAQLMMPLGFAAILGGTLTMIGSSPLIVLNDLVAAAGEERFALYDVTPIGLVLLGTGVLLFVTFGRALLPRRESVEPLDAEAQRTEMLASWSLRDHLEQAMLPEDSPLVGRTRRDAQLIERYGAHVLAVRELGRTVYAPSTDAIFRAGQRLALLGDPDGIARLVEENGLRRRAPASDFPELEGADGVAFAEVVVTPRSLALGRTLREVGLRRNHGVGPLSLLSGGTRRSRDFADRPLEAGDMILVHGRSASLRALGRGRDFALLTDLGAAEATRGRRKRAAACFLGAIGLALAGFPLPVSLFSGAVAMILLRVLTVDEAYRAISWRTVFLLAGLIPLGVAMQTSGTAEYLATQMFRALEGAPALAVVFTVAALTTAFTLFLSNVAATVVLVPLVMDLGRLTGLDPRGMALLVGICAQNSFVLPTHQVNALLMASGGYRNADYLKAGGVMTLLFLPIASLGVWWLWM